MNAPAPIRVDLIAREIGIIAEQLLALCGGDDRLYADMISGETDLDGAVSKLLEMIETEQGNIAALTDQMNSRKVRRDAAEARVETLKAAISRLMKAAMVTTVKLPEATLSIRPVAAKLKVVDPAAVPQEYCTATYRPSMEKVGEAYNLNGALPNWLTVEPARTTLSIRRA